MTNKQNFEKIVQIISDLFDVEPSAVSASSGPPTIANWDSMQHLNLVLSLEETFEMQFDPPEIEAMRSVGAILDVVDRKQAALSK